MARTTQLNIEVGKAMDIYDFPVFSKIQEEILDLWFAIIATDCERIFNLNVIRFEEINQKFGRIIEMIRKNENTLDETELVKDMIANKTNQNDMEISPVEIKTSRLELEINDNTDKVKDGTTPNDDTEGESTYLMREFLQFN